MSITGKPLKLRLGDDGTGTGGAIDGAKVALLGTLTGSNTVPFDSTVYDSGSYVSGNTFVVPRLGVYGLGHNVQITFTPGSTAFYMFGVLSTTTEQVVWTMTTELPTSLTTILGWSAYQEIIIDPGDDPVSFLSGGLILGGADQTYDIAGYATIRYIGPVPA